MRYFLDTEFIEDGRTIDLISIGIVAEDGREFYACNKDCDLSRANDWVKANVLPQLIPELRSQWRTHFEIKLGVLGFIADDPKPEFWGYYADYDWVAFCQLFGTMMDLPKGWPMYCRDLKQLADAVGNPQLPEQGKGEHNALADAHWNKEVYGFLKTTEVLNDLAMAIVLAG